MSLKSKNKSLNENNTFNYNERYVIIYTYLTQLQQLNLDFIFKMY